MKIMDVPVVTIQAVGVYLTGLSGAVDQKILSVEQAKFLARAILVSTKLLPERPREEEKNAPNKEVEPRVETSRKA